MRKTLRKKDRMLPLMFAKTWKLKRESRQRKRRGVLSVFLLVRKEKMLFDLFFTEYHRLISL